MDRSDDYELANDKELLTKETGLVVIDIPEITDITSQSKPADLVNDDLRQANVQLKIIREGWGYVKSIADLSRMVDATIKGCKHRRDVLGAPYGYQPKDPKRDVFEPLD